MITQYFSKQSNHNFMHKLGNALDECNNKNKQLPNKIIAKTINSIAAYIIIEDNLVLYKGLIKRISKDIINPNILGIDVSYSVKTIKNLKDYITAILYHPIRNQCDHHQDVKLYVLENLQNDVERLDVDC